MGSTAFVVIPVLHGTIRMEMLEGESDMEKNQLMAFHPGIPHSIEAKTNTLLLLTTYLMKAE
jgi:mannose-6-phosphate isomerase-like protein (cupin superfamily)